VSVSEDLAQKCTKNKNNKTMKKNDASDALLRNFVFFCQIANKIYSVKKSLN
jgi:hypothetical protein